MLGLLELYDDNINYYAKANKNILAAIKLGDVSYTFSLAEELKGKIKPHLSKLNYLAR